MNDHLHLLSDRKSVFSNEVTPDISTTLGQVSCTGEVGQHIIESTVVGLFKCSVLFFGYSWYFWGEVYLVFMIWGSAVERDFCFLRKNLKMDCYRGINVLQVLEEKGEYDQNILNLKLF